MSDSDSIPEAPGGEGTADPESTGVDTTSDGLLMGSSNQTGLSSYYTRPTTNPVQTRDEILETFNAVLAGVQTENTSFGGGVDMDFGHTDAPTSALEQDAVVILDGVLDGDQTENTDFGDGVNMDFEAGSNFDFSAYRSSSKLIFQSVLRGLQNANVDFGTISLDYVTAPSLVDEGKSINIADAAEGLLLAHVPNTASPGGAPGAAVNFDLTSATELKPIETGADLLGEGTTLDPETSAAAISEKDSIDPDPTEFIFTTFE